MKRALSLVLAIIMLMCSFCSVTAYSATKVNAEDKLVSIQKLSGFVPGKDAIVIGNCYGFISKVCEKLYGVKYDGEGLYGNYRARHETGNYYTVKMLEITHSTPTEADATKIMNFFLTYAKSGDVIHYGAYTTGTSNGSTHTFMVQHVDNNKLQIYHSNYGYANYTSAMCHIDTIYWDSFIKNPTKSIYNSDNSCYSANSIFYNKMKNGGVGITINRYSKYDDMFEAGSTTTTEPILTVTSKPAKVVGLEATNIAGDNVTIKWDKASSASKYYIYIKNDTKGTNFNKTVTETSAKLNGLTEGNTYTIYVRGVNSAGVNGAYSDPITVTTILMPAKVTGLNASGVTADSATIKWTKATNAQKYYLYCKNNTDGTVFGKTVTDNQYTLTELVPNNEYCIKVRGISADGTNGAYSSLINIVPHTPLDKVTGITYTAKTGTSLTVKWSKLAGAEEYRLYIKNETKGTKIAEKTVTGTSTSLNNLTPGYVYSVKICGYSKLDGYGPYSSVYKDCTIPNKTTLSSVTTPSKGKLTVKWKKVANSATGYQIWISTDKKFAKDVKKVSVTGASTISKSVTGMKSGKVYYVKIRAYKTINSKNTYGPFSSALSRKCK